MSPSPSDLILTLVPLCMAVAMSTAVSFAVLGDALVLLRLRRPSAAGPPLQ